MSDELSGESTGGVSPQRKKISAAILIVLLAVLAIELLEGLGHSMSGKALQAAAPEGVFEPGRFSHADVAGLLKLWPTETVLRDTPDETEYQYSWFSVLRPLFSRPPTNVYVAMAKNEPATAIRYGTEGPSEAELEAARNPIPPMDETMIDDGMGGMGGGPGGPGGPGGGEGRGGRERRRPQSDGEGGERQRPPQEEEQPAVKEPAADDKPAEPQPADDKPATEESKPEAATEPQAEQ